jgi:hypothetical protein
MCLIILLNRMNAPIYLSVNRLWLILKIFDGKRVENYLWRIIGQVNPIGNNFVLFCLLEEFYWLLVNLVWIHLLKLLNRHRNYFFNLEKQECILTKELPWEVFVPIMVHQVVIMGVSSHNRYRLISWVHLLSCGCINSFQKVLVPFFFKNLRNLIGFI